MRCLISLSFATVLAAGLLPASLASAEEYIFDGVLQEGDTLSDGLGQAAAYSDVYTFGANEGDEFRFLLEMQDAYPQSLILDSSGARVADGNSGGSYAVQWDWRAPAAGEYRFVVTTLYIQQQAYRLTFTTLPPGTIPPPYQRQ